ncbi:MAG: hypothetical protein OJI67_00375 [Prosthecobacter sp.]|nr:hypothetical protein [Prosthecobacter sp.]
MKLQQDQVWHQGDLYLRIVHWDRTFIVYKAMENLETRQGTEQQVSKKEFCRLIKGATLLTNEEVRELSGKAL